MKRLLYYFAVLILSSNLFGCGGADVVKSWDDVLSKCAESDLMGDSTLFFGMSNNVGPGSIWRATKEGGYGIRWLTSDLDPDLDSPPQFVHPGVVSSCQGNRKVLIGFSATALLETKVAPLEVGLVGALNKARDVTVEIDGWSLDQIREGPFERWATSLDDDIREEFGTGKSLVMVKAVKVSGISVVMSFDTTTSAELRAKLPDPVVKLGDLGASMEAKWKSDSELQLKSNQPFYIVGELSALRKGGGGRFPASGTVSQVKVSPEVEIIKEGAKVFSERDNVRP